MQKADNLMSTKDQLSGKYGSLDFTQLYEAPWPVIGIVLPFISLPRCNPVFNKKLMLSHSDLGHMECILNSPAHLQSISQSSAYNPALVYTYNVF